MINLALICTPMSIKRYALRLTWWTLCKHLPMNSKFVDFRGTVSDNWNKTNEQPNNNETLEKKKNSYAKLSINKWWHMQLSLSWWSIYVKDCWSYMFINKDRQCQSTKIT